MRRNEEIDIQALIRKAESDDHCEAYVNLERNRNYRVGVVARTMPSESRVYIEVLVYLLSHGEVDLQDLKKKVTFLEELQKRKYSLVYQEDNFVACETEISASNVKEEYETIRMLARNFHST